MIDSVLRFDAEPILLLEVIEGDEEHVTEILGDDDEEDDMELDADEL